MAVREASAAWFRVTCFASFISCAVAADGRSVTIESNSVASRPVQAAASFQCRGSGLFDAVVAIKEQTHPPVQHRWPLPKRQRRGRKSARMRPMRRAGPADERLGVGQPAIAVERRGGGVGEHFLVGTDRTSQPPEERVGEQHDIEQPEQSQPAQIAVLDVRPFVCESRFEAIVRLGFGEA